MLMKLQSNILEKYLTTVWNKYPVTQIYKKYKKSTNILFLHVQEYI